MTDLDVIRFRLHEVFGELREAQDRLDRIRAKVALLTEMYHLASKDVDEPKQADKVGDAADLLDLAIAGEGPNEDTDDGHEQRKDGDEHGKDVTTSRG